MILKNNFKYAFFAAMTAYATPALAGKTVDGPGVDKGAAYIEWQGSADSDHRDDVGGSWTQELNAGYGLTDWMNLEVGGALAHDGAKGGNTNYEATNVEARFEFAEPGVLPIDLGATVGYGLTQGDGPDGFEVKLIGQKVFGPFFNRANVIFDRAIGDNSAGKTTYGFSDALGYAFSDEFQAGLEWYSDFGTFNGNFDEQSHQLGPVIYGEIGEALSYELGILGGISDAAPDAEVKAVVGYGFTF